MENEIGFYRLKQIIGDRKAKPPIPPILPFSRSTFLNGVKSGKFPPAIKLSQRIVCWKKSDIIKLAEDLGSNEGGAGDDFK